MKNSRENGGIIHLIAKRTNSIIFAPSQRYLTPSSLFPLIPSTPCEVETMQVEL